MQNLYRTYKNRFGKKEATNPNHSPRRCVTSSTFPKLIFSLHGNACFGIGLKNIGL